MTVLEPVIEFLQHYSKVRVGLSQVVEGALRPRKPVLRVMDRLVKEGCLVEISDEKISPCRGEFGRNRRNPTWEIITKPLLVNFVPRPKRDTARDKIWRLVRARRRFTRREVVRLTGVAPGTVEDFTQLLERNGYLRIIGKDSRQYVYMLINDPGPKRPITPEVKKNNAQ